jgi:hypothetical protein
MGDRIIGFATGTNTAGETSPFVSHKLTDGTSAGTYFIEQRVSVRKKSTPKAEAIVESAVYSYIQAVRALGKKSLSANEIAKTLSLSPLDVNNAIVKLRDRGVKIISR